MPLRVLFKNQQSLASVDEAGALIVTRAGDSALQRRKTRNPIRRPGNVH